MLRGHSDKSEFTVKDPSFKYFGLMALVHKMIPYIVDKRISTE